MLLLLRQRRPDLALHVVHLNHETRGNASAMDAQFVHDLAKWLDLPVTIARRSEIEPRIKHRPRNLSAHYRRLRWRVFADVAAANSLGGVILAHQADDQAETILHRLLRGSGAAGVAGMAARSQVKVDEQSLILNRPLLAVRRRELREYLEERGQMWREDSSNASMKYARNRLRRLLEAEPELVEPLLQLGETCRNVRDWVRGEIPELGQEFDVRQLQQLPAILAEAAGKKFLADLGVPMDAITPAVVRRLIEMANDAATPNRQSFPGDITLWRRQERIGKLND